MAKSLRIEPDMLSEGGDVFSAPWEAQVFAMAVQFSEAGLYSWKEWTGVFSAEIAAQEKVGYEPVRDYYHCWARALEKILAAKGHITESDMVHSIEHTIAHWPHPDHIAARDPIATDPARS